MVSFLTITPSHLLHWGRGRHGLLILCWQASWLVLWDGGWRWWCWLWGEGRWLASICDVVLSVLLWRLPSQVGFIHTSCVLRHVGTGRCLMWCIRLPIPSPSTAKSPSLLFIYPLGTRYSRKKTGKNPCLKELMFLRFRAFSNVLSHLFFTTSMWIMNFLVLSFVRNDEEM